MADDPVLAARTVEALVEACAGRAVPRYVSFWGHRPRRPGVVDRACLSQWWPAPFENDGRAFASAEHYMMWRKAELFDDRVKADEILLARSPAHAKALGQQVAGFDQATWEAHRWEVVVNGSFLKFTSSDVLKDFLLGTRRRVLIEASPRDLTWGIGLAADSGLVDQPEQWRGLNLLGFALMEARQRVDAATRSH